MERIISAGNDDMWTLLFHDKLVKESGAPSLFVEYVRDNCNAYDEMISLLENAMYGIDSRLSAIAHAETAELVDKGIVFASTINAIRYCATQKHGQGLDAGVIICMAQWLKDFTIEYNEKGETIADLYCMKEPDGFSTMSIRLEDEVWLLSNNTISIPIMPETWVQAKLDKPLKQTVMHPAIDEEDIFERCERFGDHMDIMSVTQRRPAVIELSPGKRQTIKA